MSDRLDETALRRPEFDAAASEPLVLADGQTWHLRKPLVGMRVEVDGTGAVTLRVAEERFGRSYTDLLQAYVYDGANDLTVIRSIFGMGVLLLRPNYDVPAERLAELFSLYRDEEASQVRFEALRGFVIGSPAAPKA